VLKVVFINSLIVYIKDVMPQLLITSGGQRHSFTP